MDDKPEELGKERCDECGELTNKFRRFCVSCGTDRWGDSFEKVRSSSKDNTVTDKLQ